MQFLWSSVEMYREGALSYCYMFQEGRYGPVSFSDSILDEELRTIFSRGKLSSPDHKGLKALFVSPQRFPLGGATLLQNPDAERSRDTRCIGTEPLFDSCFTPAELEGKQDVCNISTCNIYQCSIEFW